VTTVANHIMSAHLTYPNFVKQWITCSLDVTRLVTQGKPFPAPKLNVVGTVTLTVTQRTHGPPTQRQSEQRRALRCLRSCEMVWVVR